MMKGYDRQNGLTMIGWFVIFVVVVFFGYIGIKVAPVYINHYMVVGVLKNVVKEIPESNSRTSKEMNIGIKKSFDTRLQINSISYITSKSLFFKRDVMGSTVQLTYDRKVNLFRNMTLVIHFNNKIEIDKK